MQGFFRLLALPAILMPLVAVASLAGPVRMTAGHDSSAVKAQSNLRVGIPVSVGVNHRLGTRIDAGLRIEAVAGSLTVFVNDEWSRHPGSGKLGATLQVYPMNGACFIDPYIGAGFAEIASQPIDYIPETCGTLAVGVRVAVYRAFAIRAEMGHAWLSSNILSGLALQHREANTAGRELYFGLSLECDMLNLILPSRTSP